ncbi:cupin-like domain-containing protein [Phakopsora pachyrhizi]|nr:cupin-like domain-containing protein [Phakopsora pachyrhizi]
MEGDGQRGFSRAELSLQNLIVDYQGEEEQRAWMFLMGNIENFNVDEFVDRLPTAMELSRQICRNRPLVIRSYHQRQQQHGQRDARVEGVEDDEDIESFILSNLGPDRLVTVARTPDGNADSIVDDKYFVEPQYERMRVDEFFKKLKSASLRSKDSKTERGDERHLKIKDHQRSTIVPDDNRDDDGDDVLYLQSQNGNLSDELSPLIKHLGSHLPLASKALGKFLFDYQADDRPDAVNLWIGDERSSTSLHKDPYENFYLVLKGSKSFTIFPPIEYYCMHEGLYIKSSYRRLRGGPNCKGYEDEGGVVVVNDDWIIVPDRKKSFTTQRDDVKKLERREEDEYVRIPWIPITLKKKSQPSEDQQHQHHLPNSSDHEIRSKYQRFKYSRPMRIKLYPGDLLYLPSNWFHQVDQSPLPIHKNRGSNDDDDHHLIIACNWWYDMDYTGSSHSSIEFIRREVLALNL